MLRILRVSRRWLTIPAVVLVAGACAAERLTSEDSTAVEETVVLSNLPALQRGASQRLVARLARGQDTTVVTDVTWSSENTAIATITDGNLLTAVATGTTYVGAERRGKRGRAQVVVVAPPVASIRISPTSVSLLPGGSATISATPVDANGVAIDGVSVSWSSSDATVAPVASGTVTAQRTGSATIMASVEGVVGTSSVVVSQAPVASIAVSLNAPSIAVGSTVQANATPRDASGGSLAGRPVTWSSSNPGVATVSASGLVTAVSPGSASIRATAEGITGQAALNVEAQIVTSITLQPSAFSLSIGGSQVIAATLRDGLGATVAGRQPTWTSLNPGIATVAADGRVTAVALGTATIRAAADNAQATATVTVLPNGTVTASVSPATLSLVVGGTGTLAAQLRDAANNVIPGTFTWSSSNAAVASVDANGRVSGIAGGSATITANSDGRTATATVTVTPPAPATASRVTVSPTTATLTPGATQQLTATAYDASNNVLTGRTITWSTSTASVATVSAAGLVTAVSAGSATITATVDGRTATAAMTVQAPTGPNGQAPAGYTVVSQQDFGTCAGDGWGNCGAATADPDFELTTDPTAPRSGGTVLRNWFRVGFPGGNASMPPMERFLPANQRRLYGSIWFKLSPNFEGHLSGVNKLGYLWMHGGAIVYFSAQGAGQGPLEMQIRLQGVGAGPATSNLRPNLGPTGLVSRGEWHRFEYIVTANTPGVLDGGAQFWLDGVEIGRYNNLGYAGTGQTNTWDMASVFPHWGGVQGVVTQDFWMMFDHYTLATAP